MKPPTDTKVDSRLAGIEAALRRAAVAARELAVRTQTPLFVLRNGKIVNLNPSISKVPVKD